MGAHHSLEITLTCDTSQRRQLVRALEDFCRHHAVTAEVQHAVDLALEEHVTNIFSHGGAREITVRGRVADGYVVIEVEDDGVSFDPLSARPANTDVSLEEMPVGGLGIHLMREFMDELAYSNAGKGNLLQMKKRLTPETQ